MRWRVIVMNLAGISTVAADIPKEQSVLQARGLRAVI